MSRETERSACERLISAELPRVSNMLAIRFLRTGKRNQPFFRVVVTDKRNPPRGGRFLEVVGFFNPLTKEKNLKAERIKYWLSVGAQPSVRVHNLLISERIIEGKKIDVYKKSKKKEKKPEEEKSAEKPKEVEKKEKSFEKKPKGDKAKKEEVKEVAKKEKVSEEKPKEEPVKEPEKGEPEKPSPPIDK